MALSIERKRLHEKAEKTGGWVADRDLFVDQETGELLEADELAGRAAIVLCRKGRLVSSADVDRFDLGDSEYPISKGGGWYEASDGEKFRDEDEANEYEKRLRESPPEDKQVKQSEEDK